MDKESADQLLLVSQRQVSLLLMEIKNLRNELRDIRSDYEDMTGQDLIPFKSACKRMGISYKLMEKHIQEKRIEPVTQTGPQGKRFFYRSDLNRLINSFRVQQTIVQLDD